MPNILNIINYCNINDNDKLGTSQWEKWDSVDL